MGFFQGTPEEFKTGVLKFYCIYHQITFQNENITFWLLQSPSLPAVLTGKMDFNILYCQQIGDSGVVKVVTDDTWFAVP